MTSLAGTGTLIRFILRRDRIRIPVWVIAFALTMAGTASIFPDTYPTDADRQTRATLIENPAMRILLGPLFGTEDYTFGAMMASEMLGLATVVVGLMGIFMIARHTRAEEESGRAELVRASIVGRYAGMTAALIVAAAASILVGLGSGLGLYVTLVEFDLHGSLLFGAAIAGTGIVFAAITAVTVQINEFTRGATGMSIAVLGVSYVVRGFGDMLENALMWTPPFGLTLQTGPFVENRWWPLLIAMAIVAALIPLAFYLSTKRDVAASLRPPNSGPAHASSALTAPLGLTLRLQRGSIIAWGLGIILFGLAYGTMVEDIGEMYAENPMVVDYFAVLGLSLEQITDSVISMFVMFFGLIASIFAVGTITRLRTEETSLRAENVLATAISRVQWAGEAIVVGLIAPALVIVAAGAGAGLVYASDTGDISDALPVIGAALVYIPALWIAVGVAIAVFGLIPRAMGLAWFIPAYGFFALMIGPLLDLPDWLYNLSPFEYVPRVPSADFELLPLVVMSVIAAGLIAAGLLGIRRRDMDFV
jgi:ABC-2 type transport system permease protein